MATARPERSACQTDPVSWAITILGIVALIVLHELGHFTVAKAVGMRVERFSVFFPPTIAKVRRGETEYGIGAIPAGGYVKITGMNPEEIKELEPEVARRAYYNRPPWQRIAVILAGPAVNLLIAFVLFAAVLMMGSLGGAEILGNLDPGAQTARLSTEVSGVLKGLPADGVLHPGDRIVRIEGRKATPALAVKLIGADTCPGTPTDGCRGARPVHLLLARDGKQVPVSIRPQYDAKERRMLVGFDFGAVPRSFGPLAAAGTSAAVMWKATTETIAGIGRAIVNEKEREHVSSIVGITEITQQAVATGLGRALVVIGYVSLILGVVNLFPFLPLDGGHILWSLAEKLRGKRVSLTAMWRFSSVGLVLLAFLVINGLSNDIGRIAG